MDIYTGLLTICGVLLGAYYLGVFKGAPFLPTDKASMNHMLAMANIKSGDKLADLGSGDGRIIIAAAKAGAEAHGFEVNPLLVLISRIKIRRAGLKDKAFVHWKNYWLQNFSEFNVVTIFGITHIMTKFEQKLKNELPIGAKIICNTFPLPTWPGKQEKNIYLYNK